MFVQSTRFVEEHQGRKDDIHIFGQEFNADTWKLAKMNLAIRGIDGNLGERDADTFGNDQHKTLKADYILANPPFNISDYTLFTDDSRWAYGIPPSGNANYAWISHMISKLSSKGIAGFVMANGSMSTSQKAEIEIRKNIIEDGLVDCIVTLPSQLFYNVAIPVCLWIVTKNKNNRRDKILFIDASKMGTMVSRKHRELSEIEIQSIYDTYYAWKNLSSDYQDINGFCKLANLDEVRKHEYIITPGRYVGLVDAVVDGKSFEEKMAKLTEELSELLMKSHKLEDDIREQLGSIGYEI